MRPGEVDGLIFVLLVFGLIVPVPNWRARWKQRKEK